MVLMCNGYFLLLNFGEKKRIIVKFIEWILENVRINLRDVDRSIDGKCI